MKSSFEAAFAFQISSVLFDFGMPNREVPSKP